MLITTKKHINILWEGYKRKIINWKSFGFFCITALLLMVACQKDGELQTAPQVTDMQVRVFSPDTDSRFTIFIDDQKLSDTLVPGNGVSKVVLKTEGEQHLLVKDIVSNTTLMDTMLVLDKPSCMFTVLQYDTTAESKPLLFRGGGTSSDIPEDSARLAIYLGNPDIPTPVDIYLYRSNTWINTLDTTPIHIFRGVNNFSATDFVSVAVNDSVGFNLEVRSSATGELVTQMSNNTGVSPEDAFSGITSLLCAQPGTGVPTNIHNLLKFSNYESIYWVECMVAF